LRYARLLILLVYIVGCRQGEDREKLRDLKTELSSDSSNIKKNPVADTTLTRYPMAIANDKSVVEVRRIRKGRTLDWQIRLIRAKKEILRTPVTKTLVVDSNSTVFYQDSLHQKYMVGAIIREISYDFIRANSLYFNVIFENTEADKEIQGRFNLYYGPKRKGEIYGFITDNMSDISSE